MQYPKLVRALTLAGMLATAHCAFSQASQGDRQQLSGIENAIRTGDFAQAVQLSHAALAACGESPDTCTKELRGFHKSYL